MARKYGVTSQESVEKAIHKMKAGQLKSGRSGKTVKSLESIFLAASKLGLLSIVFRWRKQIRET